MTIPGQSLVAILASCGIIAQFPEYKLGSELNNCRHQYLPHLLKIEVIAVDIGNSDIDIIELITIVLVTEADMENIFIMLEDIPGAVGVVAIGIHDSKPLHALLSQRSDGQGSTVEIAHTTKEVSPSMVVTTAGESKGIIDIT